MKIFLIFVLTLSLCGTCFALESDYKEALIPISVLDFNLYRFNEDSSHVCGMYREMPQNDIKSKALSFLDFISVKKGAKPFSIQVRINLRNSVQFQNQEGKIKEYAFDIILEDLVKRLKEDVSLEILREHLYGEITWSSFSNAAKKHYDKVAIIDKGNVIKINSKERDYLPGETAGTYIGNGLLADETGKVIGNFPSK